MTKLSDPERKGLVITWMKLLRQVLVKLQLVLTFGSIIYHIHQGYMAARPADVGQAVIGCG